MHLNHGDSMGRGRILGEFMAANGGRRRRHIDMFPSIHTSLLRILELMKGDNRDQFRETDAVGQNPIQVMLQDEAPPSMNQRAVETTVAIHRFLIREFPESISMPDERGRLPIHYAVENKWPIGAILDAYPAAASARDPVSGRLPIHYAVQTQWPIGAILDAYPAAASVRDPVSGLHPFQLAAVAGSLDSLL